MTKRPSAGQHQLAGRVNDPGRLHTSQLWLSHKGNLPVLNADIERARLGRRHDQPAANDQVKHFVCIRPRN